MAPAKPIKLVIAALGGQGGGVLADWLIDVAHHEAQLVQSTSVPGVAQRTGATIYYVEFFPRSLLPTADARPVMALMPHPGDVDVVIASEIMEAGRAMQRGIVTPGKTTLIASSHRVYAIGEKSHLADGRADEAKVAALAHEHAKRFICFDMQAIATANASVISAAMLGALAGSGALPFANASYRKAIEAGGIAVARSLAAFDAAAQAAAAPGDGARTPTLNWHNGALPSKVQKALDALPATLHQVAGEGARRLIDYQDASYALAYLRRLARIVAAEHEGRWQLSETVAQGLALWMSFEDTIRVADLKIRASRAERVKREVAAPKNQLVTVTEFMKPRLEEIAGTLPARLGQRLLASPALRRTLERFTGGRQINTSRVGGYLLLYGLACLRRFRRGTLRFAQEHARIERWLDLTERAAAKDYPLAIEIADAQRLVKGYGSTHERGVRNFELVLERATRALGCDGAAARVRELCAAASADEEGKALSRALANWPETAGSLSPTG